MASIKYILYIVFLCFMFYPLTMGSLYCDDALYYLQAPYEGISWLTQSIELTLHWIKSGRLLILPQFTGSAIDQFTHSIVQYKLVLFALNILATVCCYIYIKQLHNSISFGLFAFFYLGIIQYHMVFDGYHSFFGYYPILSILTYSCLFLHLKHLKTGKNTFYLASILLFFLLLVSGEIGLILPFVLIVQTFAFSSLNRSQFKKLMPYFGLSLLYIAATYYLRQHIDMQTSYEGIQSNFDLFSIFRTWLIQLLATIPFTGLYSRAAILQTLILTAQENWLLMVLVMMGMLGIVWMIRTNYSEIKQPLSYNTLGILVTLLCLSAAIIAPSIKYQEQLHFGLAYLPVMIQYQAFAAILCFVFLAVSKKTKNVLLGLFIIMTFITYASNLSEIKKASRINEPLISLKTALDQGLNKRIEDNAIVYYDYFIDLKWFLEPIFNRERAIPIELREMRFMEKDSLLEQRPYYTLSIQTGHEQRIILHRVSTNDQSPGEVKFQWEKPMRMHRLFE